MSTRIHPSACIDSTAVIGADAEIGDILLALISRGETTELKSVKQLNDLLGQLEKSANVTLLVRRGDVQTFITIKGLPAKGE